MTKLLSEQELREEIISRLEKKVIFDEPYVHGGWREQALDILLPLIHSQKLAHADMVIGNNETDLMMRPPMLFNEENSDAWDTYLKAATRDLLRVEQRERNK